MTMCKPALANLTMWVRDRYFSPSTLMPRGPRVQPFVRLEASCAVGAGGGPRSNPTFQQPSTRSRSACCLSTGERTPTKVARWQTYHSYVFFSPLTEISDQRLVHLVEVNTIESRWLITSHADTMKTNTPRRQLSSSGKHARNNTSNPTH